MKDIVIGIDLGDKKNSICVLDKKGDIIEVLDVSNTTKAMTRYFSKYKEKKVLAVLEAGTHSPWVSRLIEDMGHKVLVGNPRKLRAIWASEYKTDVRDAEMLARIGRFDPKLLYPIKHRGGDTQADLDVLKARDCLVRSRTSMINYVRSAVKATGGRIKSCSAASFHKRAFEAVPEKLQPALGSMIGFIYQLTEQIRKYDKQIERLCKQKYDETWLLQQISGVGPVTALAFVLTIEDPRRFKKSRKVGPYVGLIPRRDQSGETDKQLRITKAGSGYLRRLLVGSAHYIMGPFGPDCELRRFGMRIAISGSKKAKRRAVVAVARKLSCVMHARKLSCVMHRLWITAEVYDPFYNSNNKQAA